MRDVIRAAEWSTTGGDPSSFLSDFVQRQKLPKLALVTKGQYLNVGAPNVAAPTLNPYVLIYSAASVKKLVGRLVKWRDNRLIARTDQQVALNDAFRGYFEILSEGGKPTRCLESVKELADVFPDVCVVRQSCKAYLAGSDGEMTSSPFYKSRTVKEGEILTLVGQFNFRGAAFLRCFDENGKSVFLKIASSSITTVAAPAPSNSAVKHKFSPVVTEGDAIMGAHKASNLTSKRLPITVRMIAGTPQTHLGGNHTFPVIRLEKLLHQEEIFVYSLSNNKSYDGQFLKVPSNAHLMLAPISNQAQMIGNPSYQILLNKCFQIYAGLQDRICHFSGYCLASSSDKTSTTTSTNSSGASTKPSSSQPAIAADVDKDSGINDEEIDELYDYIRGVTVTITTDNVVMSPVLRRKSCDEKQPPINYNNFDNERKVTTRMSNETFCKLGDTYKAFSKSTDKLAQIEVKKPARKNKESAGKDRPARAYYFGDHFESPTFSGGHSDNTKPKLSHQVKNQQGHYNNYYNRQKQCPEQLQQKCRQDQKHSRVYKSCHNLLDANCFWENELYLKQSRHMYQY